MNDKLGSAAKELKESAAGLIIATILCLWFGLLLWADVLS